MDVNPATRFQRPSLPAEVRQARVEAIRDVQRSGSGYDVPPLDLAPLDTYEVESDALAGHRALDLARVHLHRTYARFSAARKDLDPITGGHGAGP